LLLLTLRAPDVALAQIAVGTVALPLMFLAAIATARRRRPEGDPDSE
jgi:energy-converting hydrogenase B subunit D